MAASLTIGELFPADDLLARWVFSVTAAAESMAIAELTFVDTRELPPTPPNVVRLFFHYRHLLGRIHEASRPIEAVGAHPEIRTWVDEIPAAAEPLAALLRVYSEGPDGSRSIADETFGLTRNRAVHLARPGTQELREILEQAAELPALIHVDHEAGTMQHLWPEFAAITSLTDTTDPDAALTLIRSRARAAQDIISDYARLVKAVLPAHCDRLGIDGARLLP
jgi:hypothetical protein